MSTILKSIFSILFIWTVAFPAAAQYNTEVEICNGGSVEVEVVEYNSSFIAGWIRGWKTISPGRCKNFDENYGSSFGFIQRSDDGRITNPVFGFKHNALDHALWVPKQICVPLDGTANRTGGPKEFISLPCPSGLVPIKPSFTVTGDPSDSWELDLKIHPSPDNPGHELRAGKTQFSDMQIRMLRHREKVLSNLPSQLDAGPQKQPNVVNYTLTTTEFRNACHQKAIVVLVYNGVNDEWLSPPFRGLEAPQDELWHPGSDRENGDPAYDWRWEVFSIPPGQSSFRDHMQSDTFYYSGYFVDSKKETVKTYFDGPYVSWWRGPVEVTLPYKSGQDKSDGFPASPVVDLKCQEW